jgi:hypothetical protein
MACAQYSQYSIGERQEDLQAKIHQFNKRFEAKMMDLSAAYLPLNKRRQFLIDSLKIKENVAFYDSSVLDVQLFNNDLPVQIKSNGPGTEFNKAIVTMRYQMSLLPSNQVKTIIVDQQWLLEDEEWFVDPKLDNFFK